MAQVCFITSILLLALLSASPLPAQVQITEFMASNSRTLKDDFGQYEDWIELHNYSPDPVNLAGWSLTDSLDSSGRWQFPATNMPPGSYLVVFASNRDRKSPGLPLHTNFRLSSEGEYLALLKPDGFVATEFAPNFPPQLQDVAYGLAPRTGGEVLVDTNAPGRVLIPLDGSLADTWTSPTFPDQAWLSATNGLGFETGETDDPATVSADILADSPVGFWRFSESSGLTTVNSGSAGAAANGQLVGPALLGVPGPSPADLPGFEPGNLALRLDGLSAKVEAPYSAALNPPGPFTVELWAKPARSGGPSAWILSSMNVANGRNGYAIAQDYSAKTQWEFRLGDAAGYIAMAYGGTVDTTRWQHIAGVYDGTTARLYVDGQLAASSTLGRPYQPNDAERTVIGARINEPNPYYWAGDVDEVAIIPQALSAAEIAARYQMGTNSVPSSPTFNYSALVKTDLLSGMFQTNSTAYLRIPFPVEDAAEVGNLKLRVKFEDGFVAWINGHPVASSNAPAELLWNSAAISRRATAEALSFAEFNLGNPAGLLQNGQNLLALQGLNLAATNTDFLLQCELEASGAGDYADLRRYFVQASPGTLNGLGTDDLGPVVTGSGHYPSTPGTNDSITITCRVDQAFAPISTVTLNWRVMFNALTQTPMLDDGLHGDGAAGDGVYGTIIPNETGGSPTYAAGQMVRWFVTAADSFSRTSRWPLFEVPSGSEEYLGTVIQPDYITSRLPVFHLFAPANVLQPGPNTSQIGADSESGGRVAIYYDGEFYDNVYMELRGNTSAGLNKKAHRLEFNREHPFRHPGPGGRIRKSSLLAEHLDPAYIRQHLCYWFLNLLGVPSAFDYPVRTQLNGAFYQLAFHTEVLGEEHLERLGYDPNGALYKCVGQVDPYFSSTGGFQKLLPKANLADRSDYLQLANGINETKPAATRRATVFDLLDVAQVVNYLAGARWCAENDDVWANMCLYRDTYGDGLWRVIPFDMNASWGQLYGGCSPLQATDDNGKSHPFYGGSQVQEFGSANWNRIYDVIVSLPETRDMLRRRERTLLDTQVLPPGTPASQLIIENYISQVTNQIFVEANLDRQKWGYSPWAGGQNFNKGVGDLFTQFVSLRRRHWYVTHSITNTAKPLGLGNAYNAGLPLAQPADAVVSIIDWDVNPASGNQDQEFICVTNQNNYAVDLSGWTLSGGISHEFTPGTVMPANSALYLSPNVAAFRTRSSGPRGGLGLFVQGNYRGRLNAWGETLTIRNSGNAVVSTATTAPNPSLAQQYLRITEIMYNPAPQPNSLLDPQLFEYIKLKNTSKDTVLNLAAVRFTNGVAFQFTGFPTPTLAPGTTVLLVRDSAAFTLRYGSGFNIGGTFTGSLDNSGETLRLEDSSGEKILEFAYNNSWYPITDGLGFSLVIVDESAPWSAWDRKSSWRPSAEFNGSPGAANPALSSIPIVLVNEVLSHSVSPLSDAIELFNPNDTPVDVGNWLLTDDFYSPAKYQLPADATIPAHGFLLVDETAFGAGDSGFRLSQNGEEVHLFSAAPDRQLTGFTHGFNFPYSPANVTFGRYVTSQGEERFVLQSQNTLGTANASPQTGPVVISEIHYHPPDLANGIDDDLNEFVELQNLASTNVPLYCTFTNEAGYGASAATNTWRLRSAVDYEFPPNTVFAANSPLLLVGFDPADTAQSAAFRSRFSVPASIPIFGPWRGKLDNSGECLRLLAPDQPTVGATNLTVPYFLIDEVCYADVAPWPTNADGAGDSLQRLSLGAYGNDVINWFAAAPTAGASPMQPPSIVSLTLEPSSVTITVATQPGFTYSLEYKNDLADPGWSPLPPPKTGTGGDLTFRDEATPALNRFYRVRASP